MYSFPNLEPVCCCRSSSNSYLLTCILNSQEAGKVVWYSHLFNHFLQFVLTHRSICHFHCKIIRSDTRPKELWMEVHYIVQEAMIMTIPKKKKCTKAKWLSEEALQIAEKRREAQGNGEKERYTYLNAEF